MFDIKKFLTENKTSLNEEPIAVAPEEIYKIYLDLYDLSHRVAKVKKRGIPTVTPKHTKLWTEILDHLTKAMNIMTVLHADARKVKK